MNKEINTGIKLTKVTYKDLETGDIITKLLPLGRGYSIEREIDFADGEINFENIKVIKVWKEINETWIKEK